MHQEEEDKDERRTVKNANIWDIQNIWYIQKERKRG